MSQGLAGIDFLTMFTNRGTGSFAFEASTDNQGSWIDLFTVVNTDFGTAFRQGVTFDAIFGVTDVRLTVDSFVHAAFIGEVDLYAVAVPLPASLLLLFAGLGVFGIAARGRDRVTA